MDSDREIHRIPRDTGWAWVVLLAAWLNNILVSGIYKTFGILFIEIQTKFDSTSAKTSLIYSLLNAAFSITALFVSILDLKAYSSRQLIFVGTCISSLGYLLAALVPNVDFLIVSIGIGLGIGNGFVYAPQLALIGRYFDKKKGLANCISNTGGSVGSLILPYLIGTFVDLYDLSGTLMLLSALNLNGLVYAALMRPFPSYESIKLSGGKDSDNIENDIEISESLSVRKTLLNGESAELTDLDNDCNEVAEDIHTIQIKHLTSLSIPQDKIINQNGTQVSGTSPDLTQNIRPVSKTSLFGSADFTTPSMDNINANQDSEKNTKTNTDSSKSTYVKLKGRLKTLLNMEVFKIPIFLYYLPCGILLANGASMYLSFLLPQAKDVGINTSQINSLMVLVGTADIITIPLWGMLADRQLVKSNRLVVIAMCAIGVTACFSSYYTSYGTVLVLSGMYGIFGRVYFSLSPVMLTDFLGIEKLQSAIGITMVCQSVFHTIMLPLVGLMRDNFGTYIHSYQMMGAYLLVGSAGLFIMPELAVKIHGPVKVRERSFSLKPIDVS